MASLLPRLLACFCCPAAHDPEESPSRTLLSAQHHPQQLEPSQQTAEAMESAAPNAAATSDQQMQAVLALCGLEIANLTAGMQAYVQEEGDFSIFVFPKSSIRGYEGGETFTWWLLGITEDSNDQQVESAEESAVLATGDDEVMERMFDGTRGLLEPLLRRGWDQLGPSFEPLPTTAQWVIQRVSTGPARRLMPVLRDDTHCYLLLPTSAECAVRTGALTIPDPYRARDPASGHRDYMTIDIWFEDCGDGGAYVLGLDDTVLIFYVDGPGNMVYGRWQCGRDQWESMWLSTFGSLSVQIGALEYRRKMRDERITALVVLHRNGITELGLRRRMIEMASLW